MFDYLFLWFRCVGCLFLFGFVSLLVFFVCLFVCLFVVGWLVGWFVSFCCCLFVCCLFVVCLFVCFFVLFRNQILRLV